MVKPNDVILLGVIPVNLTSVLDDVCITSYGGKKLIDPNETGVFTIGAQELKRSAVLRDISKLIQTAAPGVSTNIAWLVSFVLIPKSLCLVVCGFLEVIEIF